MFKYAIKTEITRKYYERRLNKFFDLIKFEVADKKIESKCNKFAVTNKISQLISLSIVLNFFQKLWIELLIF
jgi:hypothetical protein